MKNDRDLAEQKMRVVEENLERTTEEKKDWQQRALKAEHELKARVKAYTSLGEQKSTEVALLNKEVNSLNYKTREQLSRLNVQEREVDDLRDENRRLKRDLEITKADCD